jgi:hypothetical protein
MERGGRLFYKEIKKRFSFSNFISFPVFIGMSHLSNFFFFLLIVVGGRRVNHHPLDSLERG